MANSASSYDFLAPPTQEGDLGSLGHYRVIGEVGKGGMGYVFLAEDSKLKRPVALKVMNQKIAATAHSRRRFIHEARAMAAVHHDNVATIFEVGESKGTPFMAMELLEGSTLEVFNKGDKRLGYERIIEIALQTTDGLAAAHAKGIVHRDIKPANIWIEARNNRVKILDFGLALASSPVDHLAGRGAVIGTPGYLSPEQARSEPLDDRSDLYSLGVVLYELCTGQLPLQSDTVPGQLIAILAHRPTPIGDLNPEIPQPLCDLIHRLLRKEPRSRVASAVQLRQDLEQVRIECEQPASVVHELANTNDSGDQGLFDDIDASIPDPLAGQSGLDPFAASTYAAPSQQAAHKRPTHETPQWLSYWPIAAVALAAVIALPMMTFMFSGVRSSTPPIDVDELISQPDAEIQARIAEQRRKATQAEAISRTPLPRNVPPRNVPPRNVPPRNLAPRNAATGAAENATTRLPPALGNSDPPRPGRGIPAPRQSGETGLVSSNPTAEVTAVNIPPADLPPALQPRRSVEKVATNPAIAAVSGRSRPPAAVPDLSSAANPAVPNASTSPPNTDASSATDVNASAVELQVVTISTGDGRGADAMVQKGRSDRFGNNPSLGIRMRGGIESHHTYLCFDLKSIAALKSGAKSAALVLTLVDDERPVGAVIRVIGIPDLEVWPENLLVWENSYSEQGLHSFPVLAETTVTENPQSGPDHEIRIVSEDLAKFIAASRKDTVTLVVAGSAPDQQEVLRFVSRERSNSAAPKLMLQVPKSPPPDSRDALRPLTGSRVRTGPGLPTDPRRRTGPGVPTGPSN